MVAATEIKKVFSILEKTHQKTMLEQLRGYTHFQLLVATLLSARSKDSTTIPIGTEIKKVFSILEKTHQKTMLEQLRGYTHFQLLVATLLSARSKDSTTI